MAVGTKNDPRDLEPVPTNYAARSCPQARRLNRCAVAITHGGAGSTLTALALGVPPLILPRGAPSQRRLAEGCADADAAIAVAEVVSAPAVREAVRALLEDPRLRAGAQRVRASIDAQPDVSAVMHSLEALATRVS